MNFIGWLLVLLCLLIQLRAIAKIEEAKKISKKPEWQKRAEKLVAEKQAGNRVIRVNMPKTKKLPTYEIALAETIRDLRIQ